MFELCTFDFTCAHGGARSNNCKRHVESSRHDKVSVLFCCYSWHLCILHSNSIYHAQLPRILLSPLFRGWQVGQTNINGCTFVRQLCAVDHEPKYNQSLQSLFSLHWCYMITSKIPFDQSESASYPSCKTRFPLTNQNLHVIHLARQDSCWPIRIRILSIL